MGSGKKGENFWPYRVSAILAAFRKSHQTTKKEVTLNSNSKCYRWPMENIKDVLEAIDTELYIGIRLI